MKLSLREHLYAVLYRACHWLGSFLERHRSLEGPYPWVDDEVLEEDREQRVKYLQIQLTRLRADNTALKNRADDWRARFSELVNMTEEQLRALAHQYDIWEDDRGWFVAVNNCVYCGCGLDVAAFRTRRDALLYAVLLQTVGYRPRHNLCCSPCYDEYVRSNHLSGE